MSLNRALGTIGAAALVPSAALAVPYEIYIEIESEEDLYDLRTSGQLSEASFAALLLLHQTGVALNRAGREELYRLPNLEYADVDRVMAYREQAGGIGALGDLVAAGALERRLAESIRPFVRVQPPEVAQEGPNGFLRFQSRWSGRADRLPPASALQARLRAAQHLDAGLVATLTRDRLRAVRWDAPRDAFSVAPESVRLEVPKAFIEWETETWKVVAGTYRVGFGQRLTFDVTGQATPNGAFGDYELRRQNELTLGCKRGTGELSRSPCPSEPVARITPDFAWTARLAGVAAGVRHLPVGPGGLQLYGWASYQPRRVRSFELRNASRCKDPRVDDDPGCAAPPVYVRTGAGGPAPTARYATLPLVGAEALGGAHLGYFWNDRASLSVTGYAAVPTWWVRGVRLDYQESARTPFGGVFGAIGLGGSFGFGRQDFFAELARSFDRQAGGGGGFGAIVRSVTNLGRGELDGSIRYYGSQYANPYARPVSAPEELDGLRARDEAGLRLGFSRRSLAGVRIRALLDGWRVLSTASLRGLSFVRVDLELRAMLVLSLWTEYRTTPARALLASRLSFVPIKSFGISLQAQHRWLNPSTGHRQRDLGAVLDMTAQPFDGLRLRARIRYDVEDLFDNHRLPQTIWLYLDSTLRLRARDLLRIRYDFRVFLDERESTRIRAPNPEHWLWLEYTVRYGTRT